MKQTGKKVGDAPAEELLAELKYVRGLVQEVGENFIMRKQGEIETLISYLAELPPTKVRDIAQDWQRQFRVLSVKPAKGRLKDLKRLDAILEQLLDSIIEHDQAPAAAPRPTPARKGSAARALPAFLLAAVDPRR
jgi:hypothetical protein